MNNPKHEVLVVGDSGKKYRIGQTVNFGVLYGRTPFGMSHLMDMTAQEAEDFINKYFQKFQKLKILIEQAKNTLKKRYAIRTMTKRKRRFPEYVRAKKDGDWKVVNKAERQAINALVQGCLSADTRVFVRGKGYLTLGELQKGALELWDGKKFTRGTLVFSGKKRKVIVKFSNGQEIVCSPDHKFMTINTNGNIVWKTVREFSKSKFNRTKIRLGEEVPDYSYGCNFPFQKITKHWKAPNGIANTKKVSFRDLKDDLSLGEVLGRLSSDGTVSKRDKNVGWLIAEHEFNIKDRLEKQLTQISKVRKFIHKRENKQDILWFYIDSCLLNREAKELKIKKHVPSICWNNKEVMRGFLRGLFDGDGGVSGLAVKLTFGKGDFHKIYAQEVQQALLLFGIRSRVGIYSDRVVVQIRTRDNDKFLTEIGFLNILKTKKLQSLQKSKLKANIQGRVASVKEVIITDEFIDMYDVVNTDSGYFMANGLIVHNSAADMMKIQMREIHKKLKPYDAHILVQIHDEIIVECPLGKENEVMELVRNEMETAVTLNNVPVIADPFISPYWKK